MLGEQRLNRRGIAMLGGIGDPPITARRDRAADRQQQDEGEAWNPRHAAHAGSLPSVAGDRAFLLYRVSLVRQFATSTPKLSARAVPE
jgi:hypothetical protein